MNKFLHLSQKTNAGKNLSKLERLKAIIKDMGKVLVAFSGGVDSTFLLKVAKDVLEDNVLAVIASSETFPEKEKDMAVALAEEMDVRYMVIHTLELENPEFVNNPPQRCYFCKMELFSKLKDIAKSEGIPYVLDGTNIEDTGDFRPGAKAAEELGVHSPLREANLNKNEIRYLSRQLGLSTWNKPSMACLSSRFPYYTEIDRESLKQIAKAEGYLRTLGFLQLRVRHHNQIARIEISPEELPKVMESGIRERIVENLKRFGYHYVTLDLAGYRTGSMNEPLSLNSDKKD
ncbi:ATP-dependent sacrificial sulfur transferase LarE [Acidobacteriota bacterium]